VVVCGRIILSTAPTTTKFCLNIPPSLVDNRSFLVGH